MFLYDGELGVATDSNGLYYMRARYYNPEIKRFINQDVMTGSITNTPTLNRYAYVNGNPISLNDPFGLSPFINWNGIKNKISSIVDDIPVVGYVLDNIHDVCGDTFNQISEYVSSIPKLCDTISSALSNSDIGCQIIQLKNDLDDSIKSGVKAFMINHKSGVDMIQKWLDSKSFTTSLGASAGVGGGYSSVNFSGCFIFDSKGNLVLQGSFAVGVTTTGSTWSVGINSSITNAPEYTKLEGNGWTVGGSALVPVPNCPVVGVGAGADVLIIPEGDDEWKYTGGMGSVLIGSPGVEAHAEHGNTGTADSLSTNIFDDYNQLYERVMEWANS